jgi:hypothetical protein
MPFLAEDYYTPTSRFGDDLNHFGGFESKSDNRVQFQTCHHDWKTCSIPSNIRLLLSTVNGPDIEQRLLRPNNNRFGISISSWKGKGRPGAHTANQDGSGGGTVRKGGNGTTPKTTYPKKCAFCSGFHPFMFYCEHFIKAKVKDRFTLVLRQKSCSRFLTMGRTFEGKRDVSCFMPDHEPYCKNTFICDEGTCKKSNRDILLCVLHITSKTLL